MTGQGMDGRIRARSLEHADSHAGTSESGIDVVLVTGLSGAGRGTAAKVLEDLGWYVADNLPPQLITRMVDFGLACRLADHPAGRGDGRAVARIHR